MRYYLNTLDEKNYLPWRWQEAKPKFSEIARRVLDEGPWIVTRHGRRNVVIVSIKGYDRLTRDSPGASQIPCY